VIAALRGLEFPLEQIREILNQCRDDEDALGQVERQQKMLTGKVRHYQTVLNTINQLVEKERRTRDESKMAAPTPTIQEREIDSMLVAGVRMKGSYSDCAKGFATLGKTLGRQAALPVLRRRVSRGRCELRAMHADPEAHPIERHHGSRVAGRPLRDARAPRPV
jgi:DNA-binding transcriptional MerR regulator